MRIYKVKVNGKTYEVKIMSVSETEPLEVKTVKASAPTTKKEEPAQKAPAATSLTGGTPINSPMQGNILDVKVKVGDSVKAGDNLFILEAMKLENEIKAPRDGKIASIAVNKGQTVNANDVLATLE